MRQEYRYAPESLPNPLRADVEHTTADVVTPDPTARPLADSLRGQARAGQIVPLRKSRRSARLLYTACAMAIIAIAIARAIGVGKTSLRLRVRSWKQEVVRPRACEGTQRTATRDKVRHLG